jgi:hypothetical protein
MYQQQRAALERGTCPSSAFGPPVAQGGSVGLGGYLFPMFIDQRVRSRKV